MSSSSYRPNLRDETGVYTRSRVRVVESLDDALDMRRTFTKKEPRELRVQPYTWPGSMQHVGDSLAVAYASDKWKDDGDFELYKHLAESRNWALFGPDLSLSPLGSRSRMPVYGPMVSFAELPMPKHIAFLGYFEEVSLVLHGPDYHKNARGEADEDDGIYRMTIAHALLGGAKMQRRAVGSRKKDEPFLFVYTEPRGKDPGGVHMIIVGKELDVEADGIVG